MSEGDSQSFPQIENVFLDLSPWQLMELFYAIWTGRQSTKDRAFSLSLWWFVTVQVRPCHHLCCDDDQTTMLARLCNTLSLSGWLWKRKQQQIWPLFQLRINQTTATLRMGIFEHAQANRQAPQTSCQSKKEKERKNLKEEPWKDGESVGVSHNDSPFVRNVRA